MNCEVLLTREPPFTKENSVKIIRDETLATLTFVPVERNEKRWVSLLLKTLKVGDLIKYDGREDDEHDHRFCDIHLRFGRWSKKKTAERLVNAAGYPWSKVTGGYKLRVRGSTEEDRREVNSIRDNVCALGRLFFLGKTMVDGQQSIIITIQLCKHCGGQMIEHCSPFYATCDACSAKCEHQWKDGLVTGGGLPGATAGKVCEKCGRVKPLTRRQKKMSQAERAIEVQRKLGFRTIYKNTPLSPQKIVEVEKAVR